MTERTGWKRPDYRVLASTGERIIVEETKSEQPTNSHGETNHTLKDTEHDISSASANGSSSSLANTSTSVEATGAASAAISSRSDLSLTDTSSQSTPSPRGENQDRSPITDISAQLSHLSLFESESTLPHITEEYVHTFEYVQTIEYVTADTPEEQEFNSEDTRDSNFESGEDKESPLSSLSELFYPDGGVPLSDKFPESTSGSAAWHPTAVSIGTEAPAQPSSSIGLRPTQENAMTQVPDQLKTEVESLSEDIDDYLDENPVIGASNSVTDLDELIKRAEDHRSRYRAKHKELAHAMSKAEYRDEYVQEYDLRLETIKKYILAAKEGRKLLRDEEDMARVAVDNMKERKLKFLVSEVRKAMDRLESVHVDTLESATVEEVTRRKNELGDRQKESQRILKSIQEIVEAGESETTITALRERHEELLVSQASYINLVHHEFDTREIEKQKSFKKSLLNIKIAKFKGYDSECDIYTFQDEFEKLHLRDTPKDHLPDLLKNNYLVPPARLLVTDVHNIDDIWMRLKEAYGDHQILLTKKLSEIETTMKPKNNGPSNGPQKVVEGLSKIINVMRDLMKLAKRHKIENKLYYGDGLNRIYRQLDGHRRRKWLESASELSEGEEQWCGLIRFLEKELKVSQQDAIIMAKSFTPKPDALKGDRRSTSSVHLAEDNFENTRTDSKQCYICGAHDHAQTNGPRGIKLVQYFACKTFSEWKNVERFNYLKSQGYCVQCLYPGADQKSGKHKDGRCQRDYVCKHSSHDKFTVKKHVLVCDEHKETDDNKETLRKFKERCMGRVKNLPDHAKDIQLHHVTVAPTAVSSRTMQTSVPNVLPSHTVPSAIEPMVISSHTAGPNTSVATEVSDAPQLETAIRPSHVIETITEAVSSPSQPNIHESVEAPSVNKFISSTPTYASKFGPPTVDETLQESAIYMLQKIKVNNEIFTIFYDSGCKSFCCQHNAVSRLGPRAVIEEDGPTTLAGVGGMTLETPHGIYKVVLPLSNGGDAVMTGVCLDKITETFPIYPLQGQVEEDIRVAFHQSKGNVRNLPDLPASVGGDTSFMLGMQYNRYFPTEIFRLPSGLSIYKSRFKNPDGSDGVVGGSHKIFTEIENQYNLVTSTFITAQLQIYRTGFQVNPDISLLGFREYDACFEVSKMAPYRESDDPGVEDPLNSFCKAEETDCDDPLDLFNMAEEAGCEVSYRCINCNTIFYTPVKAFKEAEEAGSRIDYRCVKCRTCKDCKNYKRNEPLSIREEVEEDKINRSVIVDTIARETTASLPLMADPKIKLAPNRTRAEKTYQRQLKALQNPEDKASVIKAEAVLQDYGFVEWVRNLPEDQQKELRENPIQNFIPWKVVWKQDSITSPVRPVFDASQPTPSGYSLNDIVAKGMNNLNVLNEIVLRWRTHKVAFHNDIAKMYNRIKLQQSDWCMQRYLFQESLDPSKPPEEKVIKTLIYGVKSSGNQAQRGLRLTAMLSKDEYPEANEILQKDTYMDDTLSGGASMKIAEKLMDHLEIVVNRGGFSYKGFTISGKDPDPKLSADGVSVMVAGYVWYPGKDSVALNVKDLNFAKKRRGRKTTVINEVPVKLTPGHCRSKVAEIFDLAGLLTPITAPMKADIHKLIKNKIKWDDAMPDTFRPMWKSHFEMMEEIKHIRFQRAVIPEDAVSLEAETLDFGDASKDVICVAIYIRYKRKGGGHSCQLLFSRSKLVPDGMSQPRAELFAALVNTHCGEVVRRSLEKTHRRALKFTDSQITLHWICNIEKSIELWIRNRVIEVQRFTHPSAWRYLKSSDMIADIGTRPVASLDVVKQDSDWVKGYEWMRGDESEFPMLTAEEVKIANQENQLSTDVHIARVDTDVNIHRTFLTDHSEKIAQRYLFSDYLVDPNYRCFDKVIRLTAIWFMYAEKLRNRIQLKTKPPISSPTEPIVLIITETAIEKARRYFFLKATLEVKKFAKPSQYKHISQESDGVLLYTGRILPTENVTIVGNATEVMKDLSSSTFSVPLVDRYSPLAISISNQVHWYHKTAKHTGRETVWRYVLQNCFIIEGRSLIETIGKSCERCRFLNKRTLDVIMGAVSGYNLTIAPGFYISQVDLTGPFLAYSPHNKRATIKIWFVVICCATTSSINIKVMEDYSTTSFINAFTRFSCEVGYPKTLLVDEGSQLIKGCETMKLKFWDIKFRLHEDVSVDFEVCPVGGHNFNGKVERKIREVKKSISKSVANERLALLQWETLGATIANSINNMPLALGYSQPNTEFIDLLTPNRLKLGRNNERSPTGEMTISEPNKIIEENQAIFNAWFEVWLSAHVPTLMNQPKWFYSDKDLKKGDVVLFLKKECGIGSNYQFGIVEGVDVGRDEKIRRVKVKYRNHNENIDRFTDRAVRSLVVIRRADEMSVMEEIGEISRYVESRKYQKICDSTTAGECNDAISSSHTFPVSDK